MHIYSTLFILIRSIIQRTQLTKIATIPSLLLLLSLDKSKDQLIKKVQHNIKSKLITEYIISLPNVVLKNFLFFITIYLL